MFKSLFECMDLVFSKLRILDPSDDEINYIEEVINALEDLWLQLNLKITPKMHILTCITLDQRIRLPLKRYFLPARTTLTRMAGFAGVGTQFNSLVRIDRRAEIPCHRDCILIALDAVYSGISVP